jgi:hypothetical protein
MMISFTLGVTAILGIASACALPGGAMLRLQGIAVVDASGRPVSRSRSLARAAIAWAPVLVPVAALFFMPKPIPKLVAVALPCLAIFVAGGIFAFVHPQRGVQDRVCRTYLVPR